MKCFGVLFLCVMLCSCVNGSVTHDAIVNANKSIDALSASITPECKTAGVEKQIENIKKQVESIKPICQAEIDVVRADKIKWKTAFLSLLFVVVMFCLVKIKKGV